MARHSSTARITILALRTVNAPLPLRQYGLVCAVILIHQNEQVQIGEGGTFASRHAATDAEATCHASLLIDFPKSVQCCNEFTRLPQFTPQ